jgi:hypothetical protein
MKAACGIARKPDRIGRKMASRCLRFCSVEGRSRPFLRGSGISPGVYAGLGGEERPCVCSFAVLRAVHGPFSAAAVLGPAFTPG